MSESFDVTSCREWVETPVWVEAGETLVFRAEGTWVDFFIPCSADGYSAPWLYALNRPPRIPDQGRYFRLMGRISRDGKQPDPDDPAETFPIGKVGEKLCPFAGRLFVFVNDRAGYYWNNSGSVRLSVTRGPVPVRPG
jgi:hypothetical protein